ncbi:MAG TPA: alpha/beta fold hydrolase [bacterium]|nr:alpha/beta fold hydrolase [bacterium]
MDDFGVYMDDLLGKLGLAEVRGTWEEAWIESGGLRLYAPVFAAGAGRPTVVFIPGTSVYALCYAELLYGLWKEGFNVVSFDPQGQGQSGGGRGDYTIMEHVANARTICAYARERFSGPVFVMGSSQGGIEAFYLAATDEPAAGVICHNIADLPSPDSLRLTRFGPGKKRKGAADAPTHPSRALTYLSRAMLGFLKAAAAVAPGLKLPIALYLDLASEPMRVFGNAWAFLLQDPLALKTITLRAFCSIATTPLPRPVAAITTPILVLHSSGDHIFPEDYVVNLYNQLTCDKAIKIYPDLPHLITIEHVPRILPDVSEWIRAHSSS